MAKNRLIFIPRKPKTEGYKPSDEGAINNTSEANTRRNKLFFSERRKPRTFSPRKFILVALFLSFTLILLGFSLFGRGRESELPAEPQVREVPFEYEVVSVSKDEVVLRGEKGDVVLPNAASVRVFTAPETPAGFSALSVGQKVKVKTIPGEAAWITIL